MGNVTANNFVLTQTSLVLTGYRPLRFRTLSEIDIIDNLLSDEIVQLGARSMIMKGFGRARTKSRALDTLASNPTP